MRTDHKCRYKVLTILISGEHIDYCGYAVLPMAIEQDVVIATAPDNDEPILQISNTNADYP